MLPDFRLASGPNPGKRDSLNKRQQTLNALRAIVILAPDDGGAYPMMQ